MFVTPETRIAGQRRAWPRLDMGGSCGSRYRVRAWLGGLRFRARLGNIVDEPLARNGRVRVGGLGRVYRISLPTRRCVGMGRGWRIRCGGVHFNDERQQAGNADHSHDACGEWAPDGLPVESGFVGENGFLNHGPHLMGDAKDTICLKSFARRGGFQGRGQNNEFL
jgi:hypothetical protein